MASIVFEVECECEGVVIPAEPDIGFGREVGDADLSSVSMQAGSWVKDQKMFGGRRYVYRNIDLLEGLDATARKIVIANIMDAFGKEINAAILEDAE